MTTPNSTNGLFADALKAKVAPAAAAAPQAPVEPAVTTTEEPETEEAPQVTKLQLLKDRAKLMGIKHSNNIGEEALKKLIDAKMNGGAPASNEEGSQEDEQAKTQADASTSNDQPAPAKVETKLQKMRREQMRLVRLRIQNLDPKKKDLPGEVFTFGNRILGTVKKYIPYGEATDNGYHVPYCIYKQLRDRKFLNIKVRKVKGREQVETSYVREFSLEELPPLTTKELAQLAAAQAAAGSVG